MFKLVICDDEGKTTIVPLIRDEVTIGRKEGNTIRLTDRNVSRNHARLVREGDDRFVVYDLGSDNGTKVNGEPIHDTKVISSGDQLYIGDYNLSIRTDVSDGVPMGRQMAAGDNAGIGKVTTHARLVMVEGPHLGLEYDMTLDLYVVGRSDESNIYINDPSISRAHARLDGDDHQWTISDLDSINGIFVNGNRRDDYVLKSADIIELGTVRLRFVAPGEPYEFFPATGDSIAPSSSGKPNKLIFALGALTILAVAVILIVVFLGGPDDRVDSGGEEDGNSITDGMDYEKLVETGKDKMQEEAWAEAARMFARAISLKPESVAARDFKKTALAEMDAQSALIAALSAQEARDWKKAMDSLAMIPRSSHYYDIEQLRTVSGYLCEELLEKALFMSRSGNVAQAKAVLVEIGEIQEVQDDCTSKRDALSKTIDKRAGAAVVGPSSTGKGMPSPKPVDPNPYKAEPKPKPEKKGTINPYADDTPSKKKGSKAEPTEPTEPAPPPVYTPPPAYPTSGGQVNDSETPPSKKGPKKITWD